MIPRNNHIPTLTIEGAGRGAPWLLKELGEVRPDYQRSWENCALTFKGAGRGAPWLPKELGEMYPDY